MMEERTCSMHPVAQAIEMKGRVYVRGGVDIVR